MSSHSGEAFSLLSSILFSEVIKSDYKIITLWADHSIMILLNQVINKFATVANVMCTAIHGVAGPI